MYWYIVHLKVYIVYTLYLESRQVVLPFSKLLPVDGFKPTMHAVQQMVVWHSLHGSVYHSEASEIHESSRLATRKDILTCWNSLPCDDTWLPIFDLFWVQPRTRQRWCCREGGSIHAIVASQQGPHEWQGHDGCPTPTSRCLCLDLADAVRFVCPKSNETLLTPGDIATSTRISLYKGSLHRVFYSNSIHMNFWYLATIEVSKVWSKLLPWPEVRTKNRKDRKAWKGTKDGFGTVHVWIPVDVIVAPSVHLVKRAPFDAPLTRYARQHGWQHPNRYGDGRTHDWADGGSD